MTEGAFLSLLRNASFLLALAVVYDVATAHWTVRRGRSGELLIGLLLATVGIGIMRMPWILAPGVVFDTRSVLLSVTGLVFGGVPTLVAMAVTVAFRLSQGGEAAGVGVAVIIASGSIGLGWRHLRRGHLEDIRLPELYLMGLVVHVVMLGLMLTLPRATAAGVLGAIAVPVMVIYPVATAVLGTFLIGRLRRERIAAELGASEERLRLALAAADQGVYDLDLEVRTATVNDQYAWMLGFDPHDFHETYESWVERLHPDDREQAVSAFEDYLSGRRADYRMEFRLGTRPGGWRWVLSVGEIVERDPTGKPVRMLGTHTDVTARREAEEQARQAQAEMARLVKEGSASRRALLSVIEDLRASDSALRALAEDLEQRVLGRTSDLEEANRELEAFAYSVSHDLRAPVRAVSGFSQILTRRHLDGLDAEGRHYLSNIVAASEHMGQLIEDLLAYSRLGRGAIRREPVRLEPIIERLRRNFGEQLTEPGARLDIEEPLATPLGDPTLVEQVMVNFVANALTYRRPGVPSEIRVAGTIIDGEVVISVADNGIGIALEHHERIFEVFTRLNSDEDYAGTGIGLAIARKAAVLMDGEITVDSAPGRGSTFSVHLPAGAGEGS